MILLTLGLLSAFGPLSFDLYLPALPTIGSELGATDSFTQLTLSACMIGLAMGQLLAGPISDRVGRRRPLLFGLVVFTGASVLCALAPSMPLLVTARFLEGIGGGAGVVIARAVVRDLYPAHRLAHVFSLLMVFNGIAPVLAPLLGGALLGLMSWRGLFVVLGGVGVVVATLALFFLDESLPLDARRPSGLRAAGSTFHEVASERVFAGACMAMSLAAGCLYVYIALCSFVFQHELGISARAFSEIFAANSLGILLVNRINARLLRRRSPVSLLGCALVAMAVSATVLMIGAQLGWGMPGIAIPLFCVIALLGAALPNSAAIALAPHASRAGIASALLGATQFAIGAVVGPAASLVATSMTVMTTAMLICVCASLGVYWFVLWPARLRLTELRQALSEAERGPLV